MRKVLLIAAAVMLLASSVSARAYIGIYRDLARVYNYSTCTTKNLTGYIWCLPDATGVLGFEFKVGFPPAPPDPGYQMLTVTTGPGVSTLAIGTLDTGISGGFVDCTLAWAYTHKFVVQNYVWSDDLEDFDTVPFNVPDLVNILPHPDTGRIAFTSCEIGFPMYDFVYLTPLYVCRTVNGPLGVQEKSWGAIKSLF